MSLERVSVQYRTQRTIFVASEPSLTFKESVTCKWEISADFKQGSCQ